MQSRACKNLTLEFTRQYIDEVSEVEITKFIIFSRIILNFQFLGHNMPEEMLPFAKLIPIITKAYSKLSSNKYGSLFHKILNSPELYQFTLIVFNFADELPNFD